MYPGAPEIYPKKPFFGRPKIIKNLTFRLSDVERTAAVAQHRTTFPEAPTKLTLTLL